MFFYLLKLKKNGSNMKKRTWVSNLKTKTKNIKAPSYKQKQFYTRKCYNKKVHLLKEKMYVCI